MRVDLHIHTTFSGDSTLTVNDAFIQAQGIGLAAIGITDHDTIDAMTKGQAGKIAQRAGVSLIPGIEASTSFAGRMAHLLIYSDEIDQPAVREFLDEVFRGKLRFILPVLHGLRDSGHNVSDDDFRDYVNRRGKGGSPLAAYLLAQGIIQEEREYGGIVAQFMPAELKRQNWAPPLEHGILAAHESGAVAILAHSCHGGAYGVVSEWELDQLRELGLDGLEVYHPAHTPAQRRFLRQYAEKHDWLVTGGSDYHGLDNPSLGEDGLELLDVPLPAIIHLRNLLSGQIAASLR